ncbi:hypothetical protein PPYR_09173 [Photinus pyralis]|uniref:Uncharacterized protein n=1 Tax=Photinus pyralis TaxID=7054 RepID=A0A1Y1MBF2_PHOPY|nr:uncharacterized protein LOC116172109 [Photinus pyralis]XP_031345517.1 uncharacterized protein LOC116172440 [Photinus pyralis]KAB0798180.1 hypothetical protein PPYR_09173 [Photinus pyralis]
MKSSVYHTKTMIILASVVTLVCSLSVPEPRKAPPEVVAKWNEMVMPYHELCLNETHIDPEPIIHMLSYYATIPEEREIHCYWKCFQEHAKFISNGKVDLDFMVKTAYNLSRELAEKCVVLGDGETDLCQKSYIIVKCIVMDGVV